MTDTREVFLNGKSLDQVLGTCPIHRCRLMNVDVENRADHREMHSLGSNERYVIVGQTETLISARCMCSYSVKLKFRGPVAWSTLSQRLGPADVQRLRFCSGEREIFVE